MRFEIPQFINIEDKLFGPFTFKQALYLVGGGGMVYVLFQLIPQFLAIIFAIPIIAISLAFVFYRPNGRPFSKMIESFLMYSISGRFYIWKQEKREEKKEKEKKKEIEELKLSKRVSKDRIKDISFGLDILEKQ